MFIDIRSMTIERSIGTTLIYSAGPMPQDAIVPEPHKLAGAWGIAVCKTM